MKKKIIDNIFILLAIALIVLAFAKVYSGYFYTENIEITEPDGNKVDVVVYSKIGCIYCIKAKELLDQKNIKYKIIELSNNKDLHLKLAHQTSQTTVPYIFIDNKFIGGFEELKNFESSDKL